jgi:hypothetical protein
MDHAWKIIEAGKDSYARGWGYGPFLNSALKVCKEIVLLMKEISSMKGVLSPQQQRGQQRAIVARENIGKIGAIEGFASCTDEQQTYMIKYVRQMIEDDDDPEFALAVVRYMVLLYEARIDEQIPKEHPPITDEERMQQFHKRISGIEQTTLASIMDTNGGDYNFIIDYMGQQKDESAREANQAMRYYLLTQRQDGDVQGEYYLGKIQGRELTKEDLKGAYDRFFSDSSGKKDSSKEKQYAKTVAIYKAFTAIALNKINFPGKDRDIQLYSLSRNITQ